MVDSFIILLYQHTFWSFLFYLFCPSQFYIFLSRQSYSFQFSEHFLNKPFVALLLLCHHAWSCCYLSCLKFSYSIQILFVDMFSTDFGSCSLMEFVSLVFPSTSFCIYSLWTLKFSSPNGLLWFNVMEIFTLNDCSVHFVFQGYPFLISFINCFVFVFVFFFVILVMAIVICLTNFQLLIFPFLLLEVVGKGVVHLAP